VEILAPETVLGLSKKKREVYRDSQKRKSGKRSFSSATTSLAFSKAYRSFQKLISFIPHLIHRNGISKPRS
jgi:hypothetical protein